MRANVGVQRRGQIEGKGESGDKLSTDPAPSCNDLLGGALVERLDRIEAYLKDLHGHFDLHLTGEERFRRQAEAELRLCQPRRDSSLIS
jgi:hypothetical protein